MVEIPEKLTQMLRERSLKNALRGFIEPGGMTDFSSNDYLGFGRDPGIFERAMQLLKDNNILQNGATGSRLLTGNHVLYGEAEKLLCEVHGSEAALIFNSGYDANIGLLSAVPQRTDLVFYDELVHASIRDGLVLSRAKNYKFRHNDLVHLKEQIAGAIRRTPAYAGGSIYVVTESVFSMDGDSPDLKALATFCHDRDYRLIVDEAHATGVYGTHGAGLIEQLGETRNTFARIVTFGKAIGSHGAAVLGSEKLKSYLVNFSRSFIYSTGLPPHSIATLIAAYQARKSPVGDTLRQQLDGNIHFFKQQLEELEIAGRFTSGNAVIHCCIIKGNKEVKQVAGDLRRHNFDVRPIISPTVPIGKERLRFCLHAYNTREQITEVLTLLKNRTLKFSIPQG